MLKYILYSLGALLSVSCIAAPLWVDTPNNQVNIPGTMVSDQIYRDHYQLAIKPDLISMVTNGIWTTNNIFSWNSTAGAKDCLWLDNGRLVGLMPNTYVYFSNNDGKTWTRGTDFTALRTYGYPPLASDVNGHIYCCGTTNTPYLNSEVTVLRSSDFGMSWTTVLASSNKATRYPTFASSERGDLFVGASRFNAEVSNQYYVISHDTGNTWEYLYPSWQAKLYKTEINSRWSTYAGNGCFIFVSPYADSSGFEIARSTDYGTTWSINSNYVAAGNIGNPYLSAGEQGRVMLSGGTSKKVYISYDYGASWKEIGTKSTVLSGAVNLFGSKWIVSGITSTDKKTYYTPDDFVTLIDLGINPFLGGYNNEMGMRICKKGLYTMGNYTSSTNQDFLALRTTDQEGINPVSIPIISGSPVAFPGSVYSDGTNFYRSTNGTTWVIF